MGRPEDLDFPKAVYSLHELSNDIAELLVGERLPLDPNRPDKIYICIELDKFFESRFGTKYTAVEIYGLGIPNHREIQMTIKGVDNFNFYCNIKQSSNINLSMFICYMEKWFGDIHRYRYINLHALEDELNIILKEERWSLYWN